MDDGLKEREVCLFKLSLNGSAEEATTSSIVAHNNVSHHFLRIGILSLDMMLYVPPWFSFGNDLSSEVNRSKIIDACLFNYAYLELALRSISPVSVSISMYRVISVAGLFGQLKDKLTRSISPNEYNLDQQGIFFLRTFEKSLGKEHIQLEPPPSKICLVVRVPWRNCT